MTTNRNPRPRPRLTRADIAPLAYMLTFCVLVPIGTVIGSFLHY